MHRLVTSLLLGLACALPASAQWASNRGYQLIQRVDDVLFGIDNLSLQILDRQHVMGTLVRVNAARPDPIRGSQRFVVDCRGPMRFALVPENMTGRPSPEALEFGDVKMLEGSWAAAVFSCEVTNRPGAAAQLARELYERGGPPDMRTVYCELQPDGREQARNGVAVRFSEAANAVAVNDQWLSSGRVTATELVFGSNSKWHVDRASLGVRRLAANGQMLFSGTCDRRPPPRQPRAAAGSGAAPAAPRPQP